MHGVPASTRDLLVYGGSFDPPHAGHVKLPRQVQSEWRMDHLLYVPAANPPHKSRKVTAAEHRLAMLRLILADQPCVSICDIELNREGPSFTVDTLVELREQLGESVRMRLLIGADMALTFSQWYEPQRVMELAEPIVMLRGERERRQLVESLGREWESRIAEVSPMEISSTQMRTALADAANRQRLRTEVSQGDRTCCVCPGDWASQLPTAIVDYILEHELYLADQ